MERQNGILIDWLSITSKSMQPEDMMNLIGITEGWQLLDRGVHGYGARLYNKSIQIHYGGTQKTIWLEMSGQGCRTFEEDSTHKDYNVLFEAVLENPNDLHITRLDVAFDDYTNILDIDRLAIDALPHRDDPAKRRWKSKLDYTDVQFTSKGTTVYIGSAQSLVRIRVYDKLAERLAKMRGREEREKVQESIPHWIRCELQLRDERALEFIKYLIGVDPVTKVAAPLTLGQAYRGVIENYLDFGYEVPARGKFEKMVWHRFPYWQNFLQGVEKLSLYRKPGEGYNLERMMNFVQNNAGNAIDAALYILGPSKFFELIEDRKISQSSKYMELMQQHGSYADRLQTDINVEWLNNLSPITAEEKEERHPMLHVFTRRGWVVWSGVRHLMCRECNAILPEKAFHDVKIDSNFALCYKCAGKKKT